MMKNPRRNLKLYRQIAIAGLIVLFTASAVRSTAGMKPGGTHTAVEQADSSLRDPFWPVGFQPKRASMIATNGPQAIVEQDVSTDWNKAMQEIEIQGVSSRAGNEFYAVINGEVKGKGDSVSVQVGHTEYTWMIDNISPPSSVKMRRVSVQPINLTSNEKEGSGYDN